MVVVPPDPPGGGVGKMGAKMAKSRLFSTNFFFANLIQNGLNDTKMEFFRCRVFG